MINIAISTALLSPIHFLYAIAECQHGELIAIPNQLIHLTDWGTPLDLDSFTQVHDKSTVIHVLWLSIIEKKLYSFVQPLEDLIINDDDNLLIGCSNGGNICIWRYNKKSSEIISYSKEKCIDEDLSTKIRKNETVTIVDEEKCSLDDMCDVFNCELSKEINIVDINNGVIDNWMKQFIYRYIVHFNQRDFDEGKREIIREYEGQPILDYIEESLFDGTYNKLHDGGLMKYHQGGKPKRLFVHWHIGKSEYSAYFWFEDERIRKVFDGFYGVHPEVMTDFIIRIDAENRKYELALYRYGLKEPQVIPEDVYQLLVFKNKFEDYRSENYNQERGAWIW